MGTRTKGLTRWVVSVEIQLDHISREEAERNVQKFLGSATFTGEIDFKDVRIVDSEEY